jgi:hypothetical protein
MRSTYLVFATILLSACSTKAPDQTVATTAQPLSGGAVMGGTAPGNGASGTVNGAPVTVNGAVIPPNGQMQSSAARVAETYSIPAGSSLRVRLDQTIDSRRNRPGDRFTASLYGPIMIDGREAIPNGTRFTGHVTDAKASGRLKGRAVIGLTLDSFTIDGEDYRIDTAPDRRVSKSHKRRNFAFIGGGAATGAVIGALAGGGAGAAIGAGAGAGAGLTTAIFTGKKNVAIQAETILSFRLREPVTVTE